MSYHRFMRYVLAFEALVINFGIGALCLFAPSSLVAQFTPQTIPPAGLEFLRWYGVLLWVLAYVVLRILPMNDHRMLFPAVEALLMGDLVHLIASYFFFQVVPGWSLAFIIMVVSASTLAILRSIWLYRYHARRF